jgi:hypothetical protein
MSKVTLALAATTVGLALLSGYLWRQLDAEHDRTAGAAVQLNEPQPAPIQSAALSPQAAPSRVTSPPNTPDRYDNKQARRNAALKQILDDPHERELLKEQSRRSIRAHLGDLARELQLTNEEYAALIELLAEHELQSQEMLTADQRTISDPSNGFVALQNRLQRDIADLLGAEKAQQYAAYEDNWQVRNQVQQLRGQLNPADALTEDQNQRLIAALQQERESFNAEMRRRVPRERVSGGHGTFEGADLVADSASSVPVPEQYMRQLAEFSKRQRQRAAAILTARQLRVFDQMQDDVLTRERLEARTRALVDQGV